MTTPTLLLVSGLVLLLGGGELLVRGASQLARSLGVPNLVIGLTVVAFGTSSPELAVSLYSAFTGSEGLALGNVIGSNIFNVLLILGVSSLITPLIVSKILVRLDVPVMIGISGLVWLLALDGRIGRFDGLLLFAIGTVYTLILFRQERDEEADDGARKGELLPLILVAIGIALLVLGSRWLVAGAVVIARSLGVSDLIIGLTLVALGTSLPEVATSVMASVKGERDIAVGNIVGSNIFNLALVLALTSVVSPEGLEVTASMLRFDLPVMTAVAVACLPIFFTGYRIERWEGLVFLLYYGAYLLFLLLLTTKHDALRTYGAVMRWFVLPITALTLLIIVLRSFSWSNRLAERWRLLFRRAWKALFLLGVLVGAAAVSLVAIEARRWPDVEGLRSMNPQTTAFIDLYDETASHNGQPPADWQWVGYDAIASTVKRAVLVAEDIDFFNHNGFAVDEIRIALRETMKDGKPLRGASTLSQQLAKNLWLSPSKSPWRKLKEALLVLDLERHLSKRRILELYLNVVELGPGVYGVEAASQRYFGLPAASLNELQAAQLAASLPRPKSWHPGCGRPGYDQYVDRILRRMEKAQWLDGVL